jgi:hypothetical protein
MALMNHHLGTEFPAVARLALWTKHRSLLPKHSLDLTSRACFHDQRRVFPSGLNHQVISLFWVVSVLLILFAIPHEYMASIVDSQVVHAVMNRIKDSKVFSLENNTEINPLSRKTVRRGK